jgi:hypothetical protein
MSVDQIPSRRSKISLSATICIAVVIVGFGILHIIGGTVLQRHSPAASPMDGSISAVHRD